MAAFHIVQGCIMTDEIRFFTQLGKRLAALRKSRGLSQQQLAKAVGLSQ